VKGSFRSVWRSLFKRDKAQHLKAPKQIEMPDPVLNVVPQRRAAVNRAEKRRFYHMRWRSRATRKLGNVFRMQANQKNARRKANKVARASRRVNRLTG